MTATPDADPLRAARRRALLALAGVSLLAACYALTSAPRQSWDEGRFGPLVPHRTFPTDCSLCHLPERWDVLKSDFTFDHAAQTGLALEGAHATASCLRCHNDRGPVREFAVRGCGGCHLDPHDSTLGNDCTQCHSQQQWQPTGLIAEHAKTRFPLAGAHLAAACDRCHEQSRVGRFVGAPLECAACHQDDLARATSPDHLALGYRDDCQRCHSATAWNAAHFNHTTFALLGQHRSVDCSDCHVGGVFAGTPRDCYSCHVNDYAGTQNPPHSSSGFGTSCEQCHTPIGWGAGGFLHTTFPLQGQHASLACSACHGNGIYAGTPRDCYSCHADDYAGTQNPDHAAAGFGTNCEQCHTPATWGDGRFDHDSFPLSGNHGGLGCADCHTTGNYPAFSCIDCHEHRKSKMDSEHQGVNGYSWSSPACFSCHPDGRE